jgi:hypothetical protein
MAELSGGGNGPVRGDAMRGAAAHCEGQHWRNRTGAFVAQNNVSF